MRIRHTAAHPPNPSTPVATRSDDAISNIAISNTAISVESISKSYDGHRVVDGISLRIEEGEIFGILGANGAGKSTTVECLQGLRTPDTGSVRVLGLDPIADRARLRSVIGSQLQESSLPDRLRVAEAVALFDRTQRSGRRSGRRDIVAHLGEWGLGDQAATSFANLSGGQRQRLFIVLALLNEPRVVFLDELTQGLDPAARRDVWAIIHRIRERGTTVVLVSHFAEEIEALCDRVAVMDRGRIVDAGTPREITDRHASATTVTFTPLAGFDRSSLVGIAGVDQVDDHGDVVVVSGTSRMIAPVCAATLECGRGPDDLHVQHPTLDDALVDLIGASR